MIDIDDLDGKTAQSNWDQSYSRKENTLFYPSEELVRFVSRHIRRRLSTDTFSVDFPTPPKCIEIGSGSGRHLQFMCQLGFHVTGIELSEVAIQQSHDLLAFHNIGQDLYDIHHQSCERLPFADNSFEYAISASTLDSMPTHVAFNTISELQRTLKAGALVYIDLINEEHDRAGQRIADDDVLVEETHEFGTVQSFYNEDKIQKMMTGYDILEMYKVNKVVGETITSSRWYVVAKCLK